MKGKLFHVHERPLWEANARELGLGEGVVFRTYSVCVQGRFHVRYTLMGWLAPVPGRGFDLLYAEIVAPGEPPFCRLWRDERPVMAACDGSCGYSLDLKACVYREYHRKWNSYEQDAGIARRLTKKLRSESPSLMAREFRQEDHEDGDGHTWQACTGRIHVQYQIVEYGMGGEFRHWPCDGSCFGWEVMFPPPVTRHLRSLGAL